jgi:hypothetical protein
MSTFQKVAPWITRLILMVPVALFAAISVHYISHVTTAAGARGIVFVSGMGMTVARVGFGAFPLACGLFLLGCIFFERRLLTALAFVATLDSVVLVVRIASMFADSSVQENMTLIKAEVFLLALTAVGIIIELTRRRRNIYLND